MIESGDECKEMAEMQWEKGMERLILTVCWNKSGTNWEAEREGGRELPSMTLQ